MLNNKSDLQQLAFDFAIKLLAAELKAKGQNRGKMADTIDTKTLFEAKGLANFIEALSTLIEKNKTAIPVCRSVVNKAIIISRRQFPLLKALIRFEYISEKNNHHSSC